MKNRVKPLFLTLLVLVCLGLAAFLGFRWLDRPQEFSSLLPFSPEEVTYAEAYLDYDDLECSYIKLSEEQTQQLLDLLSQPTYHWVGLAAGISVEEAPVISLYLHTSPSEYPELILNGENMLVNPLSFGGDSSLYRMEGDSQAYHATLVAFLEDCLAQNEG